MLDWKSSKARLLSTPIPVLLLLLAATFFWKVLAFPRQIVYTTVSDIDWFFYPMYSFAQDAIRSGEFPSWNHYIFCGYPLAANPQIALFYPLSVLFLFLPAHLAIGYSLLLHTFLGGLFMYLWAKHLGISRIGALVMAIVFMFSAFPIGYTHCGGYSAICAIIWIPLLFLLFDIALSRRSLFYGTASGAILGIQFMAGHLQFSFITLIALVFYLLFKGFLVVQEGGKFKEASKLLAIFVLALSVGAFLAAIQLIPAYEFARYTTRASGMGYAQAILYSFHPAFFPLLLFNPSAGPSLISGSMPLWRFWEFSLYIGVLPLILSLFALCFSRNNRYVLFLLALAIISLLLALGGYFPLYQVLYNIVPGFNVFRGPARFRLLFIFSTAILAGYGFDFLKESVTQSGNNIKKLLKVLIILAILALIAVPVAFTAMRPQIESYAIGAGDISTATWKSIVVFIALLIIGIALLIFYLKGKISPKYFNIAAVLFILADLWLCHMGLIATREPREIFTEPSYVTFLQEQYNKEDYRVWDPDEENIIFGNSVMIYGFEEVYGYDATSLAHFWSFLGEVTNFKTRISLLHVKYVMTTEPMTDSEFVLVFYQKNGYTYRHETRRGDIYIYEFQKALPKAFVVHKAEVVTPPREIIGKLNGEDFDPRGCVFLEKGADLEGQGVSETAQMMRRTPNETLIQVKTESPGFLFLSETWYPAWKAYVDGVPTEVYKTNYAFMSVYLENGEHSIRFVYDNSLLKIGALITILTAASIAIIAVLHFKRQRD